VELSCKRALRLALNRLPNSGLSRTCVCDES
jgi:hypothetical protein